MSTTRLLRRLELPDATLEYSDDGVGQPVVLVHAGMFADWFVPLARRPELDPFRVIRVRRAGYTDAPTPRSHLRIEDHAAHLASLMEAAGVERAVICGHSSSAFMALQLAMDRPAAVSGLVLIEPALGIVLRGPVADAFARSTVGPAMEHARSGDLRGAFELWMAGVGGPQWSEVLDDALGRDGRAEAERQAAFFFRDEGPAVREWLFEEAGARAIRQPVLLVAGSDTIEPFAAMVDRLAGTLPDVETAVVAGAGHLSPLTHPGPLADAIARFVRAQAAA